MARFRIPLFTRVRLTECGLLFQTAASYRAKVVRGKTKGQNFGRIFHFEMAKIDPVWFSLFTLLLERNVTILIATFYKTMLLGLNVSYFDLLIFNSREEVSLF